MLKYIAAAWLCMALSAGKAQWFDDSLAVLPDSLVEVEIQDLPYIGDLPCCENFKVFENADSCLATIKEGDTSALKAIDFSKYTLICIEAWGDCHAHFIHRAGLDTVNKKLVLVEYEIYGGCRGMRKRIFWILLPKPPEGYELTGQSSYIDKIHNKEW